MNPVLKYPGSKWRISEWIISFFPTHHTYIEPFFGSGAILFNKKPSDIETVNDLDENVVNLFTLIRESPEELARRIATTPYSRTEYEQTYAQNETNDQYEKARRFLIQCNQGHGFRTNGNKVGWKSDVQGRERAYALSNWNRLPWWLIETAERLKSVQIECRPALELIKRHKYKNVLIYADPPYVLDTRTGKQYKFEMSDQDHIELLETLLQHPGPVVLSGYDNELYNYTLKHWHKEETGGYAEYYGKRKKAEVVWMNFKPEAQQISLF